MRILFLLFMLASSASFAAVDDANTTSLIHFNGTAGTGDITDESGDQWFAVRGCVNNGTTKKFGACSFQFDNNNAQFVQSNLPIALGTGVFTIDFWCYPTLIGAGYGLLGQDGATNDLQLYYLSGGGKLRMSNGAVSSLTVPINQWSHVAYVRSPTNELLYINGIEAVRTTSTYVYDAAVGATFHIGANYQSNPSSTECFFGYIDEFRISNVVRWTADFTPPTEEYGPSAADSVPHLGFAGDGRLFFAENGKYLLGVQP